MARLTILGSAAAVSDATHDNTHLLLQGSHGSTIVIDCGSNPVPKLSQMGVSAEDLTALILTHFHPDHVSGLMIMLMQLWLKGRRSALPVYGLHHCLQRVDTMMQAAMCDTWPDFFEVRFCPLAEREDALLLDNADFHITAWPMVHYVPTIGLRVTVKPSGQVFSYSADTAPAPAVERLAQGADLLVHEAAGETPGHSSPAQAGQTATTAHAQRLVLIHYDPHRDPDDLIAEARTAYTGPVEVAQDGAAYDF